MFGPRHTIESVTKELIDGLEEGTVLLRLPEPTEAEIREFELEVRIALRKYRRRHLLWVTLSTLTAIATLAAALTALFLHPQSQTERTDPYMTLAVSLIGGLLGVIAGYAFGYKSGKRTVELKTYMRVLRLADAVTVRRLVLRVRSGLRERELVP